MAGRRAPAVLAACAALCLLTGTLHAAPLPPRCAATAGRPALAEALSRGVNITDALRPTTPIGQVVEDMQAIRQLGFRHVRLPVAPEAVLAWRMDGADAGQRRMDTVICAAVAAHLAVILDLHPEGALALRDGAEEAVLPGLAAAWDRLAARYAAIPPGAMVFELLNEPTLTDAQRWDADLRRLLAHIRQAAPHHPVLIGGAPFGSAAALQALTPVADANVAYVFHLYSPILFTHQGADWTVPDERSVRGLAYPPRPGNVARIQAGADPALQPALASYEAQYRGGAALRDEVDGAAAWAARAGARLVVTEFGVFGDADPQSRRAWLHDAATMLEARGIGWTVWEYRGGFGIEAGLALPCAVPGTMRRALRLCPDP